MTAAACNREEMVIPETLDAAALDAVREDARREEREELLRDLDAIEANLPTLKARDYPDDMLILVEDVRNAIRAGRPA